MKTTLTLETVEELLDLADNSNPKDARAPKFVGHVEIDGHRARIVNDPVYQWSGATEPLLLALMQRAGLMNGVGEDRDDEDYPATQIPRPSIRIPSNSEHAKTFA